MAKSRKSIYPGSLGEPIEGFFGPYFCAPEVSPTPFDQYLERRNTIVKQKLFLLLEHYGIERDSALPWLKLSLCLARAHVPGFETAPRWGRRRKWTPINDALAKIEIDEHMALRSGGRKLSVRAAAQHVARKPHWTSLLEKADKPDEVLRQAYFRAKDEDVQALIALFARAKAGEFEL